MRSMRSEEHTSELQSRPHIVCRLLLEKKKKTEKGPSASPNNRDRHERQYRLCALRPLLLLSHAGWSLSDVRDRRDCLFFFFNDTPTTEIYTLSLHDALPI